MARRRGKPTWEQGRRALGVVLEARGWGGAEIGRLHLAGEGLTYRTVRGVVSHAGVSYRVVVRVPRPDAGRDQPAEARLEARVRELVRAQEPHFDVPACWGFAPSEHGLAVVERDGEGEPLDDVSVVDYVSPLGAFVEVAAAIHDLDASPFDGLVESWPTRRAHAVDVLDELASIDDPSARRAADWGRDNLPARGPSRVLHGDLLGQNILIDFDEDSYGLSVIDWGEACVGDPAYDLACVTRGRPSVLGVPMERLVEEYDAVSPAAVAPEHVRLYELCIIGEWLAGALATRDVEAAARYRARLDALVEASDW